jgi:peptidoglycan/LPS O-acetylase OafA/YrhL
MASHVFGTDAGGPDLDIAQQPALAQVLSGFPYKHNSLNFIRLFLAGLVIVSHAWPIGGFGEEPHLGRLSLGAFAVAGFFSVSGWLITQSRVSSELPSYLWRRFCRIYPGYFVALVVVAFAFAPIGAAVSRSTYHAESGLAYVISSSTLNIRDWTVGASLPATAFQAWNGSLWTLRYEVACYLLVAAIVTVVGRRWVGATSVAGLGILTAAAAVWHFVAPPVGPIAQFVELAPFFFAGAALYAMRSRIRLGNAYAAGAGVVALIIVATGVTPTFAALPIAYLCMWAGAKLPTIFQRIGRVNDISYGTYIYAFPVQQLIALLGGAKFGLWFYIVVSVAATLPLAAASWFAVEKPAQQWRRTFDHFPLVRNGYSIKRRI